MQRRLQNAVHSLNRLRDTALRSPFTITLGDVFQAVHRDTDTAFGGAFFLLHALTPVRIRFALAAGKIDTPINKRQVIGMGGPAFHETRESMNRLKTEGGSSARADWSRRPRVSPTRSWRFFRGSSGHGGIRGCA